jgi:ribosomal-protein-serine acetyltransferase
MVAMLTVANGERDCDTDLMFSLSLGRSAELRTLEPWQAEEFAAHLDRARDHIRPWVASTFTTEGIDGARATLTRYAERAAQDGARIFGIWVDGVLVGGVMFADFNATAETCELGCWLEAGAEGRGLVTAGCRILLDWAFTVRGIHRAEWHCRADNVRSAATAQRLGMTLEATLRESWKIDGVYYDTQIWSLLSTD